MKLTLNTYQIADALRADENAAWSYAGAKALAEYLEELEESTGEEVDLDVVAIRCDFSEHPTLRAWAEDYFSDWRKDLSIDTDTDEDDADEIIREHIRDNGTLIEFDGGVIVSNF